MKAVATSTRARKSAKAMERKARPKRQGGTQVEYVVYLPALKPTHLTAKQAEKAVDYAIAARRQPV